MKSSKSKKTDVDDISRETQRLVKDSHVHLPYHKSKQKSLKDFLNRQKISKEYQVSITGSKKLLHKAWELIESKEKNVEKFYNEDSIQEDNNVDQCSSNDNIQAAKKPSVNNDDDSDYNKEINLDENHKNILEYNDDEENYENESIAESELSANDESSSINDSGDEGDDDDDDDEINFKQKPGDENLENNMDPNNFDNDNSCSSNESKLEKSVAKQFIDDEAELSDSDGSSVDEENVSNFINDSGDEEEFSKKKKRKLIALSESEDENDDIEDDNCKTDSKITSSGLYTTETNMCTQQLMGLCSGQFQTQESEEKGEDFEEEFDSDVPQNYADNTNDDFDVMPKLTSVKDLFKDIDEDSQNNESSENSDFEELTKITSMKDVFRDDSDDPENNVKINKEDMPKPTSAKDFFDVEAELSESDWSSDDEDHLIDTMDKLEEEEGDKDKLDENVVKDGLDKIYMRQLLDDDQQQVTALKEMLLEDGELYSDSGRKRKFQWDEADQNDSAFKKPLFSDNEDEDVDNVLSDDEKSGNWRKERFKRESFLSQQDDDEEYDRNEEESKNILQSSASLFVKKTHIVKYQKDDSKKMLHKTDESDESVQLISVINNDNRKNSSTSITVITDTIVERNKINKSDLPDLQVTKIASKPNQFVKGSFMKHRNHHKMTNTLLYINKKPINGTRDENKTGKDESEIKSMNTVTAKASSNPFAYLLRNDTKQDITYGVMSVEKKETVSTAVQSTNVQLTQQIHRTKMHKPMNSILKQLD